MVRDGIHSNGEGQQVTCHDKDEKENPASTDELPTKAASEDFPCICHCCDLGILELQLAQNEACVGRNKTQTDQDND